MTVTGEANILEIQDTIGTGAKTETETNKTEVEIKKNLTLNPADEKDPRAKRTGEFKARREQL